MTMLDLEFLKECAIESTKDDYENIATLEPEIRQWAEEEGKVFTVELLVSTLNALVREGRLSVYRYSSDQGRFVEAPLGDTEIADLWFKAR